MDQEWDCVFVWYWTKFGSQIANIPLIFRYWSIIGKVLVLIIGDKLAICLQIKGWTGMKWLLNKVWISNSKLIIIGHSSSPPIRTNAFPINDQYLQIIIWYHLHWFLCCCLVRGSYAQKKSAIICVIDHSWLPLIRTNTFPINDQ